MTATVDPSAVIAAIAALTSRDAILRARTPGGDPDASRGPLIHGGEAVYNDGWTVVEA